MLTMKKLTALLLSLVLTCAMFAGAVAETEAEPLCNTFAYSCFAYRVPFLTETTQEEGSTVHNTLMGKYTVTGTQLDAPVTDIDTAIALATEVSGSDVMAATMTLGEDGFYSGIAQGDYSYYLVCIKDSTMLTFAVGNYQYLALLAEHVMVLEEPASTEGVTEASHLTIPEYVPYDVPAKGMGFLFTHLRQGMDVMLSRENYTIEWEEPIAFDETLDTCVGYVMALGTCITVVYDYSTDEVYSIQWYDFLQHGTNNGDIYTAVNTSGQTGAAIYTAIVLAEGELDGAAFNARVPEIQQAFTELQSWLDAASTEGLNLNGDYSISTLLGNKLLGMYMVSDAPYANFLATCLVAY